MINWFIRKPIWEKAIWAYLICIDVWWVGHRWGGIW